MAMSPMGSVEPFLDSTPLITDPAALRSRANVLGYLFFPGLLSKEPILRVRRQILEICQSHDWIQPNSNLDAGIAVDDDVIIESTGDPRWQAFYNDAQKLRDFHALALSQPIIDTLAVLFGEPVLAHPPTSCASSSHVRRRTPHHHTRITFISAAVATRGPAGFLSETAMPIWVVWPWFRAHT